MVNQRTKPILFYLSLLNLIMILFVSLYGIMVLDTYQNRLNPITLHELKGQDLVSILIAVSLIILLLAADFNRLKIKILLLGALFYFFYIYAYFSLSGISSIFYLFYVGIAGLSLYLILFIVGRIWISNQLPSISEKYPRKSLSIFLFISIGGITGIELSELYEKTIIRQEMLSSYSVFYVLDLAIIFPGIIISSILNLRKHSLGYLFTGIALIKIITILPAVIANDFFHWWGTGEFLDLFFDLIALIITVISTIFLILYLLRISDKSES